jgi:hypothetical protein
MMPAEYLTAAVLGALWEKKLELEDTATGWQAWATWSQDWPRTAV